MPAGDEGLEVLRKRIADEYLGRARALRGENRFAQAAALVERGMDLYPGLPAFSEETVAIAAAEALARKQAEERRQARIATLKRTLLSNAKNDQPQEAKTILGELKSELPPDDPFIATEGPTAIGDGYLRLANRMAERSDFDSATALASGGLEVIAAHEALQAAHERFQGELVARASDAQIAVQQTNGVVSGTASATRNGMLASGLGADSGYMTPGSGAPLSASARRLGGGLALIAKLWGPRPAAVRVALDVVDRNPALGKQVAERTSTGITALTQGQPLRVASLGLPLVGFAALYPEQYPGLAEEVALKLEERISAQAQSEPLQMAPVAVHLEEFEELYSARTAALRDRVGVHHADGILALTRDDPLQMSTVAEYLGQFETLFPAQHAALRDTLAGLHADGVIEVAQNDPLQMVSVSTLLREFERLFAERYTALRDSVAAYHADGIFALSQDDTLAIGGLGTPLSEFHSLYPEGREALNARVAQALSERLTALADTSGIQVSALTTPLAEFRSLFPERYGPLNRQLGSRIGKQLAAADGSTPENLESLKGPLREFEGLFPDAFPTVRRDLSTQIAKILRKLKGESIYKADALKRVALAALPGVEVIRAIRIELPMKEINKGNELVKAGQLSAAVKMLDAAVGQDPDHSDLPTFKKALEAKQRKAKSLYKKYVQLTLARKSRKERSTLLVNARKTWRDTTEFVAVKEPRPGQCKSRLAGLGSSGRSICYDFVSKRKKGPIMVVVPSGSGFDKPFAIGKFEVSWGDFKPFCKATKSCEVKRAQKKRPVTGISLEQAKAYAKWLSERASKAEDQDVVYRIPTEQEWEYAAQAKDKQPARTSLNCRVSAGGQIIKGHALVDAIKGKPNSWGVTNYVGNAQEWVNDGSGVAARGAAYTDDLAKCKLEVTRQHGGGADEITGFRLVREMPG